MAQNSLRSKVLEFLYSQVKDGKIPQIKKGMVEDLEQFILAYLADQEMKASAEHMQSLKLTGEGVQRIPAVVSFEDQTAIDINKILNGESNE